MRLFWSDAWLLVAIERAADDGVADLKGVIGAADGINKAKLTFEELDCGLERLCRAGLIERAGPPFVLTLAANQLLASTKALNYCRVEAAMIKMGIGTAGSSALRAHDAGCAWGLKVEDVGRADRAYSREFWKAYKELRERKTKR